MNIEGTAAVVTGAASGLGAATARMLAASGARVAGIDLPASIADAPAVPGVTYIPADVTDIDQVRSAVGRAVDGVGSLRIAVSCAGIAPSARLVSKGGAHDPALFAKVVAVNLIGTFNVMSVAAEHMATVSTLPNWQRGVIINTASIAAYDGQVGQAAYASSKGGVVSMTLPAARDLARLGIRVNTIAPGVMETPMLGTINEEYLTKLAEAVPNPPRLGTADEFARLVGMLIEHEYINGEVIRMDGALRMS